MTDGFIDALIKIVGQDAVLTEPSAMESALIDTRKRYIGKARALVRPASTQALSDLVKLCAAQKIPMVPQGGNTSHCGAATPDASGRALLIQLSRLNRICEIDTQNNTISAEAGVTLEALQEAAFKADRLFPLSLAAKGTCQIGGNLSTNAGGVHVLRYGNTRDLTLGLEVVLPNGDIWDGARALRKDNTGYDLKQLFIGAEGTLGIITKAVMKLYPRPTSQSVVWASIASPADAVTLCARLQEHFGEALTACELISHMTLSLVLQHIPNTQAPCPAAPWYVLFELGTFDTQASLDARLETFLLKMAKAGVIQDAALAGSGEQAARLWQLREAASDAQKAEGASIKHDISLPISALSAFLETCDAALKKAYPGIRIVTFGHVGDGNLHYNQSMPNQAENGQLMKRQNEVNRLVHDLVHSFKGSISAEHGIGQLKKEELTRYKSPTELHLMHALKKAWDPDHLMNPGKVIA